jgi:hypothetical protein
LTIPKFEHILYISVKNETGKPKKGQIPRISGWNLPKESAMANVSNKQAGCWIQYQLRLNGHTQKTIADEAGCSVDIVSPFLCGRKDSARVRTALRKVLGYESFEDLIKNAPQERNGGSA